MSGSSAGQIIGGVVGGVVGFMVGGPMGAVQGFSLGYSLGGVVDPPSGPNIEGPRLDDKRVLSSTYGEPIPLVYGPDNRIAGNMIWSTGLIEHEEEEDSGGKGGGGSSSTTYSYSVSYAVAIAGRPCRRIRRIWMNGKLVFDLSDADGSPALPAYDPVNGMLYTANMGTHVVFSELHFWPGTTTQIADAMMEAHEGVGNVPAYRGVCYVTFKDLQLADFGNRVPNTEFELEADTEIALSQVVHDITNRSGAENVSVTGLNTLVKGYSIARPSNGSGALAPLALAFHFDVAEQRGQARMVPRAQGMKATVPIGQMGVRQDNSEPVVPIQHETMPIVDLPKQVNVTFSDKALDYQPNTQRATRDQGSAENIETNAFPVTLDADEGRRIADRLLWAPWAARRHAAYQVSDRWVRRDPGDVLGIPVAGEVIPYKLLRYSRGDNGVLSAELQREDPELYTSQAQGTAGRLPENRVRFPGTTRLVLMDAPIWRDLHDDAGFYWAVTAQSSGWRGASIRRSSDGGLSYSEMSGVAVRTTVGDVAAATPTGPTDLWDRTTVITVVLAYDGDSLENATEDQVLNGRNAFWLGPASGVGGEVIQFATATLTAPLTYQLSNLLRGRLGTEDRVGSHGANEVFVMFTESSAGRSDFGPGDWDASRLYKPVSILTNEADTASQSFTNGGRGKTPYSPVHVTGTRDTSNNLTIGWTRRTRLQVPGLGSGPVPLGEAVEAYEVDIYSGASVVRTISASSPSVVYTAAEQTADGKVPGAAVVCRIYQLSDVRGRGIPAIATV